MTAREKIHELVDALPESEMEPVLDFVVSRSSDPLLRALAAAPEDDEPWTEEDQAALDDSRAEVAAGARLIPLEEIKRRHDIA